MKKTQGEIRTLIIELISKLTLGTSGLLQGDESLQDLGFDSLRLMDLVVSAEDELGFQLKDNYLSAEHLKTINSLVAAFSQCCEL